VSDDPNRHFPAHHRDQREDERGLKVQGAVDRAVFVGARREEVEAERGRDGGREDGQPPTRRPHPEHGQDEDEGEIGIGQPGSHRHPHRREPERDQEGHHDSQHVCHARVMGLRSDPGARPAPTAA